MTPLSIPIIDLAGTFDVRGGPGRAAAARAVGAAARETGVFRVANHGVPESLIAAHFELARCFFALDTAEKRAIDVGRSNCFRGYEAFGTQTIDAAAPGDLKEGFIMGPDLPADHPHVVARYPNTGTNLWPRRPAGFRRQMEAYVAAMNDLGRHVASILAASLGLPDDYFAAALAAPLTYSQLLHYPAVSAPAENRFGAGAHVDWGFLTLLLQDDVGGLEVQQAAERTWRAVPPVPGTFTIILGELILRLTNGVYRSATHRVVKNSSGRSRYSMPTFFDPPYDHRVACVPTCLPTGEPAAYPACTVAEHMLAMARATLSAA